MKGFFTGRRVIISVPWQCFIEILEYDPDDAFIWAEKGDVLQNLGRTSEALVAIDTALRIDPANEYALCKKSRCSAVLGGMRMP